MTDTVGIPAALSNRRGSDWCVFADGQSCSAALTMVLHIAERLRDPSALERQVEAARIRNHGLSLWSPATFSSGYAGLAVFYSYLSLAFPGDGWDVLARQSISRAAQATREEPLSRPGLHGGAAGLVFAFQCLAEIHAEHAGAAARAYEALARQTLQRRAARSYVRDGFADEREFDLISGDAGVLVALLARPDPSAAVTDAAWALTRDLTAFCQPGALMAGNWRVRMPPHMLADASRRTRHPRELDLPEEGWYNLGLAHGVLGVAVAMSAAYRHGYRCDGLLEAVDHVCSWFVSECIRDEREINWPPGVPEDHARHRTVGKALTPARPAWCYGAIGGARALWLVSKTLNRPALGQLACDAAEATVRQVRSTGPSSTPSLCHGSAGLLLSTLHFAHETDSDALRPSISSLIEDVLESCDPSLPFFFTDLQRYGNHLEDPGVLGGAIGVALALLAAVTPVEPKWDRAILMSGV